jgi:hypothetical protein
MDTDNAEVYYYHIYTVTPAMPRRPKSGIVERRAD